MSLNGLASRRLPIDRVSAFFVGDAVAWAFAARERLGQSVMIAVEVSRTSPDPEGTASRFVAQL